MTVCMSGKWLGKSAKIFHGVGSDKGQAVLI